MRFQPEVLACADLSLTGLAHPTSVITFDELGYLYGPEVGDSIPITTQFAPFGVTFHQGAYPNANFYWSGSAGDVSFGDKCPSRPGTAYAVPAPGFFGGCLYTGPAVSISMSFAHPVTAAAFSVAEAWNPFLLEALIGNHVVEQFIFGLPFVAGGPLTPLQGFVGFHSIVFNRIRIERLDGEPGNNIFKMDTLQLQAVLEPASILLLGTGAIGLLARRRSTHGAIFGRLTGRRLTYRALIGERNNN